MIQLRKIYDQNQLILDQTYDIRIGLSRKKIVYDGTIPENFSYAINSNVVDINDRFIIDILNTISYHHVKIIEEDYDYLKLKEIIKDGSILMNKIININNSLYFNKGANINSIILNTNKVYELSNHLYDKTLQFVNFDIHFYRSSPNIQKEQIMPIPFSVTSCMKVAMNWDMYNIIHRIIVPKNTSFMFLEPYYDPQKNNYGYLYEGEACLPSGKLLYHKEEIISLIDRDILLITFYYTQFTENEAMDVINKINKLD